MLTGQELGKAITVALQRKGRGAQAELARALGVKPPSVSELKETGRIDKSKLPALWKFFTDVVEPAHWGIEQYPWQTVESRKTSPNPIIDIDDSDFVAITRVDFKISAGIKGYAIEQMGGQRAPIFFRKDWLERNGYDVNALHAIPVSGESMETSLYDGDLVVVNTADTKPVDGYVFAANYEGEVVIKRFIREAGQWWLSSDNSDKRRYPNKLADESTFIIGRVIHKQSERI